MTCTCIVCGRTYTYDAEVGYDKSLCGPLCDGLRRGRREAEAFRAAVTPLVEAAELYRTTMRSLVTDDSESAEAKRQVVKVRLINAAMRLEVRNEPEEPQ